MACSETTALGDSRHSMRASVIQSGAGYIEGWPSFCPIGPTRSSSAPGKCVLAQMDPGPLSEYRAGRECLSSYVAGLPQTNNQTCLFLSAVGHFEHSVIDAGAQEVPLAGPRSGDREGRGGFRCAGQFQTRRHFVSKRGSHPTPSGHIRDRSLPPIGLSVSLIYLRAVSTRRILIPLFRSGSFLGIGAEEGLIGEKIGISRCPRIHCFDGRLARSGRRSRGEPWRAYTSKGGYISRDNVGCSCDAPRIVGMVCATPRRCEEISGLCKGRCTPV